MNITLEIKGRAIVDIMRDNGICCSLLTISVRREGRKFIDEILGEHIRQFYPILDQMEINPSKVPDAETRKRHLQNLKTTCHSLLCRIVERIHDLPSNLAAILSMMNIEFSDGSQDRELFGVLSKDILPGVCALSPIRGSSELAQTILATVFFIRYLIPALTTPESHNLIEEYKITSSQRRGLILCGKIISNMSTGTEFGAKEEFMAELNPFLIEDRPLIEEILQNIVLNVSLSY